MAAEGQRSPGTDGQASAHAASGPTGWQHPLSTARSGVIWQGIPGKETPTNSKDIGKIVKARRAEIGLNMTDLAKKIGVSQAQISRLEDGQQGFRSDTVGRLAKALKVPAFRLFMTDAEWSRWQKRA